MKPALAKGIFALQAPLKQIRLLSLWVKNMVAVDGCGMLLETLASFRGSERRPAQSCKTAANSFRLKVASFMPLCHAVCPYLLFSFVFTLFKSKSATLLAHYLLWVRAMGIAADATSLVIRTSQDFRYDSFVSMLESQCGDLWASSWA